LFDGGKTGISNAVKIKKNLALWALLGVLGWLAACEYATPYVYIADEFNRKKRDYGKDPVDITEVTICYHKRATTPETITQMAQAECGKFNKRARFVEHDYYVCPLVTPVAAKYVCESVTPGIGAIVR
jgi:hypothetical protein